MKRHDHGVEPRRLTHCWNHHRISRQLLWTDDAVRHLAKRVIFANQNTVGRSKQQTLTQRGICRQMRIAGIHKVNRTGMAAHRSPWVIGLGIDYRETLHEPENFWKAYRLARDAGFKLTAHAGEFGEHWRNVETAMDLLECERIDHGYTITDNPELAERAADQGIPFAVVPTNSYYLRTFTDEEWAVKHPIRRMVELGLKVFPNSDDPTMHHISISESWLLMMNWLGFSLADLRGFLVNSIDAAWVDDETKIVWRQLWLPEFDRLAREAFGADCLPTA